MTAEQKTLVQDSYASLHPVLDLFGDIFYSRLFEVDPTLKPMFPIDVARQSQKLIAALGVAVASLDRMDRLAAFMEDLGVRHAGYGVKHAHYATVEQALLWTLRMCLGAGFTADVRQAWAEVYGLLSTAMQRGVAAQPASSLQG
jgi:hemoglobin-like flavoprotein